MGIKLSQLPISIKEDFVKEFQSYFAVRGIDILDETTFKKFFTIKYDSFIENWSIKYNKVFFNKSHSAPNLEKFFFIDIEFDLIFEGSNNADSQLIALESLHHKLVDIISQIQIANLDMVKYENQANIEKESLHQVIDSKKIITYGLSGNKQKQKEIDKEIKNIENKLMQISDWLLALRLCRNNNNNTLEKYYIFKGRVEYRLNALKQKLALDIPKDETIKFVGDKGDILEIVYGMLLTKILESSSKKQALQAFSKFLGKEATQQNQWNDVKTRFQEKGKRGSNRSILYKMYMNLKKYIEDAEFIND